MNSKFENIVRFIRNYYDKPDEYIALHEPLFVGNEKKYLEECIDTSYVSSIGKFVDLFEKQIAAYTGSAYAVACVNGTNALHLALHLVKVAAGDEVICQPLSFIATCNAIRYCDAIPIFIDVDMETMSLSPTALRKFLKKNTIRKKDGCYNRLSGRKIAACVPMHTFGHPGKITELREICDEWNILLVEDAAESLGSYYKDKHTGNFGTVGVLSFNGNKIITTGGGGMLLFNDADLAQKAKHLSTQAKIPHRWEFVHDEVGYNYRMPNLNGALGVAQLENIARFIESKRELSESYAQFFDSIGLTFFKEPVGAKSNYWLNAVITEDKEERDELLAYLNDNKIMARPIWRLMNELPMFSGYQATELPNANWLSNRVVNLPSTPVLK